jgi:uncharacterized iron-regulated protein
MRLVRVAALLIALAVPAAAAEPPPAFTAPLERGHPLVGQVWLPATGQFITIDELVARARAADAVLLGETHDNADHHALQAWMLGRLTEDRRKPLVAFEMIDGGQQDSLRRHLEAHPGDATGLGDALDWGKSGWPDWALYRPVAQAALDAGAKLASANLPREQVRAVARGQDALPLPDLPADQLSLMEDEIKSGHCGMLPDAAVPGMVRVQRSRDAVMAAALADGMREYGKAVLIAGAGHTRADHGVPVALAARAPGTKVLALAFIEVKTEQSDPAAYGELFDSPRLPFDAVWFTPRAEREDQCEALKRHMEKKKAG